MRLLICLLMISSLFATDAAVREADTMPLGLSRSRYPTLTAGYMLTVEAIPTDVRREYFVRFAASLEDSFLRSHDFVNFRLQGEMVAHPWVPEDMRARLRADFEQTVDMCLRTHAEDNLPMPVSVLMAMAQGPLSNEATRELAAELLLPSVRIVAGLARQDNLPMMPEYLDILYTPAFRSRENEILAKILFRENLPRAQAVGGVILRGYHRVFAKSLGSVG